MRIHAALLVSSLPLVAMAACSIYDSSLLGTGGSTATSGPTTGPGSTTSGTTSTSVTASSGATTSGGVGGDMSTGVGGDSTSSGTGGAKPCATAGECPGADTECKTRTCKAGVCGLDFAAAGKALAAQTAKDCLQAVCDGAGATKSIPDGADAPDDANDCTDDTCAAGVPTFTPKATGAACTMGGGKKCTAMSTCVECVVNGDCASGVCDPQANTCSPAGCGDAVKNGTETDLNCGGAACPPCTTGKMCSVGTDCVGGTCVANLCVATCTDGIKNNGEADIDCGGPCANKCDLTKSCATGADCKTGSCVAQACSCANDHLMISEIRSRGTTPMMTAVDEFIELYNPTAADVVLDSSWTIEARSTTSASYGVRWTGTGKTIPTHGHFLIANTGYVQMPTKDDSSASSGITDASSVVLKKTAVVIDAVCYGFNAATKATLGGVGYVCEGAPADNLPHNNTPGVGDADVSIQRLPGGALGNCIDTGDNAADFFTTTPAAPQSSASAKTP